MTVSITTQAIDLTFHIAHIQIIFIEKNQHRNYAQKLHQDSFSSAF